MIKIHKSIEIEAPVRNVYKYLDNPANDPQWMASMMEVRNVTGSGAGKHFEWTYKWGGQPLKGESTITSDVPEKRIVAETKGGIESTWTYTLEQHKNATTLNLDIDYTIPGQAAGLNTKIEKLILKRSEREIEFDLMNIKETMETR